MTDSEIAQGNMTDSEITQKIDSALDTLYNKEGDIIKDATHEQTISAKLMCYLEKEFGDKWHVDVEFNRQGEFHENRHRDTKRGDDGKGKKPDIIIHKRGPCGPNLVVILIKGWWNYQNRGTDREDVLSIKNQHNYQLAFVLELGKDEPELILVT